MRRRVVPAVLLILLATACRSMSERTHVTTDRDPEAVERDRDAVAKSNFVGMVLLWATGCGSDPPEPR